MTASTQHPSHVRVAFVGSSSVEAGSPLPGALARELGLRTGEWIALGRRSARLRDWTRPAWPSGLRADAIVVLLTGNDARPRAAEVTEVDRALRALAPVVVWLPPLPYPAGSRVAGRDRRMQEALSEARVARVTTRIRLATRHWAPDRVHLTGVGYSAYARQVTSALRAALAVRQPSAPSASTSRSAPSVTSSVVGTLLSARGARLPLTSIDALWMARALSGEGGGEVDAYAITSTMLRRWALLWDGDQRSFRSLTDLVVGRYRGASPYDGDAGDVEVRGYSQPVAVQWRAQGDASRIARRRRIRALAWDAIEPWRRQAVLRLMTGRAPLTAGTAVHFAERSLVERRLRRQRDWRIVNVPGAANAFVSVEASRRRPEVRVVGVDHVARAPFAPVVAVRDALARGTRSSGRRVLAAGAAAAVAVVAITFFNHREAAAASAALPAPAEAT